MTLPGWVGFREPRGRLGGRYTKNVTICPTLACTTPLFWSWLPILPASPVSTRRGPTTHSLISDVINMYQYILSTLRGAVRKSTTEVRWTLSSKALKSRSWACNQHKNVCTTACAYVEKARRRAAAGRCIDNFRRGVLDLRPAPAARRRGAGRSFSADGDTRDLGETTSLRTDTLRLQHHRRNRARVCREGRGGTSSGRQPPGQKGDAPWDIRSEPATPPTRQP